MTRERLYLYDTTLRDGQQSQGVDFSVEDKGRIARALDGIGLDYVEGGWPGANPTDSAFFAEAPALARARLAAFGMTKRAGRSAANDEVLAEVVNAGTEAVCLVGKAHDFHVRTALGITLEENVGNIRESLAHLVAAGREALFDAEHFFDGYRANPGYALECLMAARDAGARWIVLCDTNGGTLPQEVRAVTAAVIAAGIPGERLGIHTHNDTENAVAASLAAVDAGARQVQGTLNGLGERCGNANLVSLIPTLLLKEPYASRYAIGVGVDDLAGLTRLSRMLDDILNRVPDPAAPYVGASAFTHKAGLHASAVLKDPATYEHVAPEVVGNVRFVPMSNQAGQSNLRERLAVAGIEVAPGDPRLAAILAEVKAREDRGYAYDSAAASFELLARGMLGLLPRYFEVERYRVTVERRQNGKGEMVTASEAVVVARFGARAGDERQREPRPGDPRRPGAGERAQPGAAQGPRALPGLHRRPEARRLPGAHHLGRHRGGHAGAGRQRGRPGAALVDGRGQRQHRRRELSGAAGRHRLEAGARRRAGGGVMDPLFWQLHSGLDPRGAGQPRRHPAGAGADRPLGAAPGARRGERAGRGEPGAARGAAARPRSPPSTCTRRFSPTAEARVRAAWPAAAYRTVAADMAALPFAPGSLRPASAARARPTSWACRAALAAWAPLLAPGGRLAFSEAVWLTPQPAPRARALFADYAGDDRPRRGAARGSPPPGSPARRLPACREAGWEAYYPPLAGRVEEAAAALGNRPSRGRRDLEEIAVWREHGAQYGYGFFVAEP